MSIRVPTLAVCATLWALACGAPTHRLTLVRTVKEAAGSHCAQGGLAVQSGFDANQDGKLADSEVDPKLTAYVCDGPGGASGSPAKALVRIEVEDAGSHCPYGGSRIEQGLDADGNGSLDASEVTSTQYVCDPTSLSEAHVGNITLQTQADADALGATRYVIGSVIVAPVTGTTTLTVPRLRGITGSLSFSSNSILQSASFPVLEAVRGLVLDGQDALTTISLPQLSSIGELNASDNTQLTSLTFPLVARLEGLTLQFNSALTSVSFPAARGDETAVSIRNNTGLTRVSFPHLSGATDLNVTSNGSLTTLDFPALKRISSGFVASSNALSRLVFPSLEFSNQFVVMSSPALTTLELPAMTRAGYFELEFNDQLATVTMPVMVHADIFNFIFNPSLSKCIPESIVARMDGSTSYAAFLNQNTACTPQDYCWRIPLPAISDPVYQCVAERKSFSAAQAACGSLSVSGNLLWFTSSAEVAAFQAAVASGRLVYHAWVGYSDATTEGTWVAANGFTGYDATTAPGFWYPLQPSGGTSENYLEVLETGGFNDISTTGNILKFFCRAP